MADASDLWVVCPGDPIAPESGVLRGHGTYVSASGSDKSSSAEAAEGGMLVSNIAGRVERINRLVSVRGVAGRYVGEVGDIVVGRVTEVVSKRWKVDVSARQDATLLLSSVYLSGDQRRRTTEDSLNMRHYIAENDIVSAEVHSIGPDGGLSLQSRSVRFGKCSNGICVTVPCHIIRRLKQHFVTLPCGVDLIIGVNGWIWMNEAVDYTPAPRVNAAADVDVDDELLAKKREAAVKPLSHETRLTLARVHNAIVVLREAFLPVAPDTIMSVYDASVSAGLKAKDMLLADNMRSLQDTVIAAGITVT